MVVNTAAAAKPETPEPPRLETQNFEPINL